MPKTRIYAVTLNPDVPLPIARLVKASSQAAALRHVTSGAFECAVASQDDLVEMLQRGVKVEDATAEEQASGSALGRTPALPQPAAPQGGEETAAHGRPRAGDSPCSVKPADAQGSPARPFSTDLVSKWSGAKPDMEIPAHMRRSVS